MSKFEHKTILRNTLGVCAITLAGFAACTGEVGSSLTAGTEGQGAGASTESSGTLTGGGGFNPTGGGNSNGGNENSCGDLQFEPQLVGVDMIVSVDKSGSMGDNNKWNNAEAAFTAFFQSPDADNLSVALKFWPDNGSCVGPACDPNGCANPQVPLGPLSDAAHESELIAAFNAESPGGLTPMEAALAGATQWALTQQQSAEASRRSVVVFLTDGAPNGCSNDINVIKSYAANAFAQAEILTFAVGLEGSNQNQMNQIAQAGGTTAAYFIGSNNAEQELLDALKAIQEIAVSCTFALPESPDPNKRIDPTKVDVTYDPGDGGTPIDIPRVDDESACNATTGGWYYDDNANPSVIFLCDASCSTVNDINNPNGKLGLTAGCLIIAE